MGFVFNLDQQPYLAKGKHFNFPGESVSVAGERENPLVEFSLAQVSVQHQGANPGVPALNFRACSRIYTALAPAYTATPGHVVHPCPFRITCFSGSFCRLEALVLIQWGSLER